MDNNFFSKTKQTLNHPIFQCFLLTFLTLATFWHGLWVGVPRADQLFYLHNIGGETSLTDILTSAPAFHRTHSPGDFILYRPVLFLLLGICYFLFGYDFVLWQSVSLVLHITVVLALYSLLRRIPLLKETLWPFSLAFLFAASEMGSEMVLWHHIMGYLLFSLLAILQILYLIRFMSEGHVRFAIWSLILALIAEFTYEPTLALNLIIVGALTLPALSLKFQSLQWIPRPQPSPTTCLKIAALFCVISLLLPVASIVDSYLRFGNFAGLERPQEGYNLVTAIFYTFKQISRWFRALLLPLGIQIIPGAHAYYKGTEYEFSLPHILNFLAVAATLLPAVYLFGKQMRSLRLRITILMTPGLIFLISYSFIIAIGRALPRGIEYVLFGNLHYAYIAQWILIASLGLALFINKEGIPTLVLPPNTHKLQHYAHRCLLAGVLGLAFLNSTETYQLSKNFRQFYAPQQKLLVALADWHKDPISTQGKYFQVASDCSNDALPDFEIHLRKNSNWKGPVSLADVLYPETSYSLNRENANRQNSEIKTIHCKK